MHSGSFYSINTSAQDKSGQHLFAQLSELILVSYLQPAAMLNCKDIKFSINAIKGFKRY